MLYEVDSDLKNYWDQLNHFAECFNKMSNNGEDNPPDHDEVEEGEDEGNGTSGLTTDRDKNRALVAVLKDALHPLDTQAADMRRTLDEFFECLEEYFPVLGVEDLDDGINLHEKTRIRVLKSVIGSKAKAVLEGLPKEECGTYKAFKKAIQARFLPAMDDVHTICELRQCVMWDDENTKSFVNRLRVLAARLSDLPEPWRIKLILASLRLSHKNGKVRDLFAEKMPATIQEAECLAESFEIRSKERVSIDKFNAALGGASSALPIDGVAKGYWTKETATGSSGRSCQNPSCALRRCKGNPCQMLSLQCHACGQTGHFANRCPRKQNNMQRPPASFQNVRGRFSHGAPSSNRGRMIGEAYPGYLEQAEQQQFHQAWGQASFLPEMQAADYGVAQEAYYPTEQVQQSVLYPYRSSAAPMSSRSSTSSMAGPMYHPTGELQILSINLEQPVSDGPREWWHSIQMGRTGRTVSFKMDTGAHGNVIALRDSYRMGFSEHDLQESHVYLRTFSQSVVQPIGSLVTEIVVNKRRFVAIFHVVPHCASPLFCMQDIVRAGLLELPPDAFTESPPEYVATEEFNAYKYETVSLQLRPDGVPKLT